MPEWVHQFIVRVRDLFHEGVLRSDWNGHGARALQIEAVELAMRVLGALLHERPRPFPTWIVPTFRGGLQLEWKVDEIELEIDVDPNGTIEVLFSDRGEQKEWDGSFSERIDDVHHVLDRIAAAR
ncbi:MAG TPA: hypothetical protein VF230_00450 [Acidimicrobiales bacterium]